MMTMTMMRIKTTPFVVVWNFDFYYYCYCFFVFSLTVLQAYEKETEDIMATDCSYLYEDEDEAIVIINMFK